MNTKPMPQIHPTAVLSDRVELGAGVRIEPYVIIEGKVTVGPGCILKPGAHLIGPLTLGSNNTVFGHATIGERPQHLTCGDDPSPVVIGDGNIIRENVTIHRPMTPTGTTKIGNDNYLMANAHVAHDCVVGDRCILANGALLAGHCVLSDNVYLSGNSVVHQFTRIGRFALLSGVSGTSKDIPPFIIQQGYNSVMGVNAIGMRRSGIPTANIDAVRRAFNILYRSGEKVTPSLAQIEAELGDVPEVREMIDFIRDSARGINLNLGRAA